MPEILIVIPAPTGTGYCWDICPFLDDSVDETFCRAKLEANLNSGDNAKPGPSCPGPGTYRLVRVEA